MSNLIPVQAHEVDAVWPIAAPLLSKAVKRADGQIALDDICDGVKGRDMQLWLSWDGEEIEAAAVTEIRIYPRRKVAAIPFIGGKNRNNWLGFQPQFEEWAKANGCDALEGYARPGWLRVLSRDWRHCWTVIRKDL